MAAGRGRCVSILLVLAACSVAAAQESPYLYGIHDADPLPQEYLNHFASGGVTGWVTATVAVGHNPSDTGGYDFRTISNQGHTVICRINNGYCPDGTLPLPTDYANFAQRCANFVSASQGCTMWVIGNETNLASEWPTAPAPSINKPYLTPQNYADCFHQVYDAVKAVRPTHKVITQGLAPWAGPYGASTNVCGSYTADAMPLNWVQYMNQMLTAITGYGITPDGIALHITSRGYSYADIHSTAQVSAGGQMLYWSFYVYKDWVNYGIPSSLWNLPLYATECNGYYYWKGGGPEAPSDPHYQAGWMQEIYNEINHYNQVDAPRAHKPLFHCINMYRWCAYCDGWNIDGATDPYKSQILADLDAAIGFKYRWAGPPVADFVGSPTSGDAQLTVNFTDQSTGSVNTWSWTFGDGGTSTMQNPTHVYLNPGTYTVALTVTGEYGSNTLTRSNYIAVTDPPNCIAYTVGNFEGYANGAAVMFQPPRYSSTTQSNLATTPNIAIASDEVSAFNGTMSCKAQWAWVDGAANRWLRLTTNDTANQPNPAVDLRRPITLRVRFEAPTGASLRCCVGVRETGIDVPVGQNGGTTGTIEWIGASAVTGGAPEGATIQAQAGMWQTLTFVPLPGQILPFTGDGVLSAPNNKGVLEHIAFTAASGIGPFTVYMDAITQPCPPTGDFDGDLDVDQIDFGHLQTCLTGTGNLQDDPACQDAMLNGHSYVDGADVATFLSCMGGSDLPPPAGCFN